MRFEWDEVKHRSNRRKHNTGFDRATEVFRDPLSLHWIDDTVDGEERWRGLGVTRKGEFLLVVYTYRGEDAIRIISAREATREERTEYERNQFHDP